MLARNVSVSTTPRKTAAPQLWEIEAALENVGKLIIDKYVGYSVEMQGRYAIEFLDASSAMQKVKKALEGDNSRVISEFQISTR